MIDVQRVVVARKRGEIHHIGLGDGPRPAYPAVAHLYVIKMKKILVSSVSTGGSGGEDRLTENVTLNFSWVELKYKSQKDDGTAGPGGGFSYDIETNTATAV